MRPTWSSCHIASLIRADDFPCKCDAASLVRDTCAANFDGSLGSRRCRVGSTTDLSVSRQVFDAFVPVQFNLTPLSVSSHPLKNLCVKMIRRKEKRIFHISSPSSLWRILDFYLESNFRNRSRDRFLMPSCPSSVSSHSLKICAWKWLEEKRNILLLHLPEGLILDWLLSRIKFSKTNVNSFLWS